jgi:hypothetical protein
MEGENVTVAGIRQRPVVVVGFRRACLARFHPDLGQIRRDPSRSGQNGRDPAGSAARSIQILPNPGHFGQIRPDQWPNPSKSDRIRSDPAGFRLEYGPPASGDSGWMSLDSGASNIPVTGCCRNLVRQHLATVVGCRRILAPAIFR